MNNTDLQYYRKINKISDKQSCKDLLINEMAQDYNNARENTIYRFNILVNSIDAKDIYINDSEIPIKGVIDISKKQTADTEMEEKIQVYPNQLKRGDYIKFKVNDTDILRTYLIKSKIDKKYGYDEGIFEECNHLFKWMYKGVLHTAYGIGTNQTKYTLGTDAIQAGIIESDSRYNIQMSNNDNTKTIKVGQRFLFNDGAWKVTQIEYISSKDCIRSILLGQDSINTEIDDIDNEVAGAYENKHTYTYDIPTNFEVSNGSEYTINYSVKDENGKDFDYSLVTVTTSDNTLVKVTNNNGVISVKGLAVGTGSVKLSVPIGSTSKDFDIAFEVKDVVVDKIEYKYDFKQGTTIKQYVTDLVTITRLINGVQDSTLKINYSFDSNAQSLIDSKKIIVTKVSDLSFNIKNALVNVKTTIYLTVNDTDKGAKILDNFPLVLTSGI